MKLMHFTDREVKQVKKQWFRRQEAGHKPCGFWVSDETDPAQGWRRWCRDQGFRLHCLKYQHSIELQPDARILHLRTAAEIRSFTDEYAADSIVNRISKRYDEDFDKRFLIKGLPDIEHSPFVHDIDWRIVAKRYHGIIISPYQWECRMPPQTTWYYSWDVASGCIWDPKAIKHIELVRVLKTRFPKPKTREQRRADLIKAVEELNKVLGVRDTV